MARPRLSPTDKARFFLARGVPPSRVAQIVRLHEGYVRKLVQRDEGRDHAQGEWRDRNPDIVREYRARQDRARKARRASNRGVASLAV
jgi:predicted secreted protein